MITESDLGVLDAIFLFSYATGNILGGFFADEISIFYQNKKLFLCLVNFCSGSSFLLLPLGGYFINFFRLGIHLKMIILIVIMALMGLS